MLSGALSDLFNVSKQRELAIKDIVEDTGLNRKPSFMMD